MPLRGKLIAMEGIDGSGKRTQIEMLSAALRARGLDHRLLSFPRYDSTFGGLVGRFLNGDFGPLDAVDPHLSALLFAGDRFEAREELVAALAAGQLVLADRYIASNLAHQTARAAPAERAHFLEWLKGVEYGIYALPAEELVIYLRLPAARAHALVEKKSARGYTNLQRDLQEADIRHLEQAAGVYDLLADAANWVTVECFDTKQNELRTPEAIHKDVLAAVESCLAAPVPGKET